MGEENTPINQENNVQKDKLVNQVKYLENLLKENDIQNNVNNSKILKFNETVSNLQQENSKKDNKIVELENKFRVLEE